MSASPGPGARPSSRALPPLFGRSESAGVPVASLVLGLVALLGCSWIPVVNVGALLLGPLAVLLGTWGRHRAKPEHRVMSWFGIVTGGLALVVSIGILAAFLMAENGAGR